MREAGFPLPASDSWFKMGASIGDLPLVDLRRIAILRIPQLARVKPHDRNQIPFPYKLL
jgi:hypothetical protein